jgi:hypothetical protein
MRADLNIPTTPPLQRYQLRPKSQEGRNSSEKVGGYADSRESNTIVSYSINKNIFIILFILIYIFFIIYFLYIAQHSVEGAAHAEHAAEGVELTYGTARALPKSCAKKYYIGAWLLQLLREWELWFCGMHRHMVRTLRSLHVEVVSKQCGVYRVCLESDVNAFACTLPAYVSRGWMQSLAMLQHRG